MIHPIAGTGLSSNIYVFEDERTAIIDAGTHENAGSRISEIKSVLGGKKPDILLLTHRHIDHIGAAYDFVAEFGVQVFAGEKDAEAVESGDVYSTGAADFGMELLPVRPKHLKEGDRIDLGESQLVVMETPGHTAGSISFFAPAESALFSGDTVFADGGVGRWDLPTGDFSSLLESVRRLSKLDVKALYPGHGRYVTSGCHHHIMESLRSLEHYLTPYNRP